MMLHKTVLNVARTACINLKILYTLKNVQWLNLSYNLNVNCLYPRQNLNSIIFVRSKSQGKFFHKGKNKEEEEEEEEDEEEGEQDEEDEIEVDDYLNTQKSKVIETKVSSLRLDVIAKTGFGMPRSKLYKEFYKNNIRLNGEKCLQKKTMIHINDKIDHIKGKSPTNPDFLIIDRCVLVSVNIKVNTIYVKIIQNKSLLVDDYNDY